MLAFTTRATRTIVARRFAATEATSQLVLNLVTPYEPVFENKAVDRVTLPGFAGEYGVTANHAPLISELRPGVVAVHHTNGDVEKFFVSGGFALTKENNVTDVTVPEAVAVADIDEAAVKTLYAEAVKNVTSAAGDKAKAIAQIEVDTYAAMARAVGVSL